MQPQQKVVAKRANRGEEIYSLTGRIPLRIMRLIILHAPLVLAEAALFGAERNGICLQLGARVMKSIAGFT